MNSDQKRFSFELDLVSGRMATQLEDPLTGISQVLQADATAKGLYAAVISSFKKAADDLAASIRNALEASRLDEAVSVIRKAKENGTFALYPTAELLSALRTIDATLLTRDDERFLRQIRCFVAHRLDVFDCSMYEDANVLVDRHHDELILEEKFGINMIVGICLQRRGSLESALTIWRDIIHECPPDLPGQRAWAWRNISLALPLNDEEVAVAARLSADAFIQSGNKIEASKSLKRLVDYLMANKPTDILEPSNEMLGLLSDETLLEKDLKAAALHARARRLGELGMHQVAFDDAMSAVQLRRGLSDRGAGTASSLHLAALEARALGWKDKGAELENEADESAN
jgi:hypothetical protein